MKRRKSVNLALFGLAVLAGIVVLRLKNLYVIARLPQPHPAPPTSAAGRRLQDDVRALHGLGIRNFAHPKALSSAAERIRREWRRLGYAVEEQRYDVTPPDGPAATMENLIVSLPGPSADAPILVVGAHYDTAPNTPGADDNASGVATLLELTRRFKGRKLPFELRFVAFSTEEPPFFGTPQMGSFVHARSLAADAGRMRGMICLEMLGYYSSEKGSQTYPQPLSLFYPNRGDYIGLVSDIRSRSFLKELSSGFRPVRPISVVSAALPGWIGEIRLSDQRNYWDRGWPAVMVTDTSYLRNPRYHQPTDSPERLDYEKMADVADGLESAINGLSAR